MKSVEFYATREQIDKLTDILGGEEGSAECDIETFDEEKRRLVKVYDIFHSRGLSHAILVAKKNDEGYHCRLEPTLNGSEDYESRRLEGELKRHGYKLENGVNN